MSKVNHVLSISGGKDSTAMLLEMMERGEDIHSCVFFDTKWEFPGMYDHIEKLEEYTGQKIWRLHSALPIDYWLTARPVRSREDRPEIGIKKGEIWRIGYSWPRMDGRWCTRIKIDTIDKYSSPISDVVQCIGYASDETDRSVQSKHETRFPLVEYGMTEADCFALCKHHGFDWGGLYDHFPRVSCFCCPLKSIGELRKLWKHYSELWQRMLDMEKAMGEEAQRGFKGYKTVNDLTRRFEAESNQMTLGLDAEEK